MSTVVSHEFVRDALVELTSNEVFGELDAQASLREYGIDSLSHFKLLLLLEKKSGVSIGDDDFSFSQTGTIEGIGNVFRKCL